MPPTPSEPPVAVTAPSGAFAPGVPPARRVPPWPPVAATPSGAKPSVPRGVPPSPPPVPYGPPIPLPPPPAMRMRSWSLSAPRRTSVAPPPPEPALPGRPSPRSTGAPPSPPPFQPPRPAEAPSAVPPCPPMCTRSVSPDRRTGCGRSGGCGREFCSGLGGSRVGEQPDEQRRRRAGVPPEGPEREQLLQQDLCGSERRDRSRSTSDAMERQSRCPELVAGRIEHRFHRIGRKSFGRRRAVRREPRPAATFTTSACPEADGGRTSTGNHVRRGTWLRKAVISGDNRVPADEAQPRGAALRFSQATPSLSRSRPEVTCTARL